MHHNTDRQTADRVTEVMLNRYSCCAALSKGRGALIVEPCPSVRLPLNVCPMSLIFLKIAMS